MQALKHPYRLCGRGREVFGSPAKSIYLAIIEWGWVWCEELYRSKITSGRYRPRCLHHIKAEFNNSFNIHSKCFYHLNKFTSSLNFFETLAYFSARSLEIERCFFLTDTPQKVDNSHRASCFAYSFIFSAQFWSDIQLFRLRIAIGPLFKFPYEKTAWRAAPRNEVKQCSLAQ